jgi:hypothetical protein
LLQSSAVSPEYIVDLWEEFSLFKNSILQKLLDLVLKTLTRCFNSRRADFIDSSTTKSQLMFLQNKVTNKCVTPENSFVDFLMTIQLL